MFGLVLTVISFALLAVTTNLVAAFLTLLAIGFYVVVYTMLLKRSTPQNIVLGGAAGALPPVIGWAAVTGDITLPALLLFAIVFYWTPPHFWALSLRIRGDYAAAGVPMMPVTHGVPETTRQIALYSVLMVALTLVFFAVAHMGLVFLAGTLVLGALFLFQAFAMWRDGHRPPRGASCTSTPSRTCPGCSCSSCWTWRSSCPWREAAVGRRAGGRGVAGRGRMRAHAALGDRPRDQRPEHVPGGHRRVRAAHRRWADARLLDQDLPYRDDGFPPQHLREHHGARPADHGHLSRDRRPQRRGQAPGRADA